jgi:pimeloyl-ACP methyl ester carboxylesterase
MGGFTALHLALRHPERLQSAVIAGAGYGALPDAQEGFRRESEAIANAFRDEGTAAVAERYAVGPARVQLQNKNPEQWEIFARQLAEHSQLGAQLTMLGVQRLRPPLWDLREELAQVEVPCLIIAGDEDEGCLEPDLMLKRTMPTAGLAILPKTGHTANLEEPDLFNSTVERFLDAVEAGRWGRRDPRSLATSVTGMDDS